MATWPMTYYVKKYYSTSILNIRCFFQCFTIINQIILGSLFIHENANGQYKMAAPSESKPYLQTTKSFLDIVSY